MTYSDANVNTDKDAICEIAQFDGIRGKIGEFVVQETIPSAANCTGGGNPRLQVRIQRTGIFPYTPAQVAHHNRVKNIAADWNASESLRREFNAAAKRAHSFRGADGEYRYWRGRGGGFMLYMVYRL